MPSESKKLNSSSLIFMVLFLKFIARQIWSG
jgi:hypothetical protein